MWVFFQVGKSVSLHFDTLGRLPVLSVILIVGSSIGFAMAVAMNDVSVASVGLEGVHHLA